jgi:hypothetical protein
MVSTFHVRETADPPSKVAGITKAKLKCVVDYNAHMAWTVLMADE